MPQTPSAIGASSVQSCAMEPGTSAVPPEDHELDGLFQKLMSKAVDPDPITADFQPIPLVLGPANIAASSMDGAANRLDDRPEDSDRAFPEELGDGIWSLLINGSWPVPNPAVSPTETQVEPAIVGEEALSGAPPLPLQGFPTDAALPATPDPLKLARRHDVEVTSPFPEGANRSTMTQSREVPTIGSSERAAVGLSAARDKQTAPAHLVSIPQSAPSTSEVLALSDETFASTKQVSPDATEPMNDLLGEKQHRTTYPAAPEPVESPQSRQFVSLSTGPHPNPLTHEAFLGQGGHSEQEDGQRSEPRTQLPLEFVDTDLANHAPRNGLQESNGVTSPQLAPFAATIAQTAFGNPSEATFAQLTAHTATDSTNADQPSIPSAATASLDSLHTAPIQEHQSSTTSQAPTSAEHVLPQVADTLISHVRSIRDGESLTMDAVLDPPELGRLHVRLMKTDAGVTAVVAAENGEIHRLIADQMASIEQMVRGQLQLRDSLQLFAGGSTQHDASTAFGGRDGSQQSHTGPYAPHRGTGHRSSTKPVRTTRAEIDILA